MPDLVALSTMLPKFDSPLDMQTRALQVQALQAAAQQQQQAVADDRGARAAFAANPTDGTARLSALAGVSPKAYSTEAKQQSDFAKADAETKAKMVETAHKHIDLAGQAFGQVRANPTPENALGTINFLVQNGVYTPEQGAMYADKVRQNPGGVKDMADQAYAAALSTKEQLPKIETRDTGGSVQTISTNPLSGEVKTLNQLAKTQTPDSIASNARIAAEGAANRANSIKVQSMIGDRMESKAAGTGGVEPSFSTETIERLARQVLRGDRTGLANIGRGAQGAANLVAVQNAVTKEGARQGMTPEDITAKSSELEGLRTGMRATGNISARVENAIAEAEKLAPLAIDAGRNVARSGFLPFGKAQVMFDTNTNDPNLAKFAAANQGLVTAYASAMSRGNKPTVADNQHARELLSTAKSQEAYEAIVGQMKQEMKAASEAPRAVRDNLSGEISGKGGHSGAPAAPKAGAVVDGYRFKGGDPAKQSSWEKQ